MPYLGLGRIGTGTENMSTLRVNRLRALASTLLVLGLAQSDLGAFAGEDNPAHEIIRIGITTNLARDIPPGNDTGAGVAFC